MAFKKFTLARLIEPYRRKYVGLGSEEELNNFLNPTATSAELADPTSDINTVDKYAGKPAYDTTLGEPVWADGPLPSDGWSQASGGGGGGSALETQDNGVSLSTNTALYNFQGFTITETVADEFTISVGVPTANEVYCPGYPSYSQVSTTEFTVDLRDAENLFYVGRRVRFTDNLGANTFGVVAAVDFNVTQPNDTYCSMTMDGGDTVPATISNVCLVSSDTQWSPIAGDPFGGSAINAAAVGQIGATTYVFAVGDSGKAGWSSDGGQTWTMLTTGTAENLNVCTFDSTNEEFWAGGNAGVLVSWDGTTVTLDTTSIPTLTTDGDSNIQGMSFSSAENAIVIYYRNLITGTMRTAATIDQGATWASYANGNLRVQNCFQLRHIVNVGGSTGAQFYVIYANNTSSRIGTAYNDTGLSTGDALGSPNIPSMMYFFDDGAISRMYGTFNNRILGRQTWTGSDSVTLSNPPRDAVYSPVHDRVVIVCDNAQIAYWDGANKTANDALVSVANGFDPLANLRAVVWEGVAGNFVAFADNGQICRSSNGTN